METEKNRLKIAFLTSLDPNDKRAWSGTYHSMARALQKHCGDVIYLGPVLPLLEVIGKISRRAIRLLINKNYDYSHSIYFAKKFSNVFNRKISEYQFDLIFAPAASTEIAFLDTEIPIIYASDTTFSSLCDYYPKYSNLLNVSIREGNFIERLAIEKACLILYASQWAAQSAINDYGADESKIKVVPLGANLEDDDIPNEELIFQKNKSDSCRLFFLGVDWRRKGGDIAFETLLKLEELGIESELVVCGCVPPKGISHEKMKVLPFLNKNNVNDRKILIDQFVTSDFLILPTRNECFGIVFCEANAFGLPVITTNTGGVPEVIKNGENGFMLPINAEGSDYAEIISSIYLDDKRYYNLVISSRAAFESRLNWNVWGITVKKLIDTCL